MRCDECKIEPVTPGHFCECCGRKLSLQERKALEEQQVPAQKKPAETSWGEPAPVLAKAQPGQRPDRLVGVHFAPEPYVDPVEEVAPPQVDPNLDAHFDAHFAALAAGTPAPATVAALPAPAAAPSEAPMLPVTSHVAIDPILEAHFAGLAPVEEPPVPVVMSLPAEAPAVAKVAVPTPVDEPTADDPAVHLDSDAPAARCESCGGPADDADLCSPCRQAFHSLLDSTSAPAPAAGAVAPLVEAALAPTTEVAVAPVVVAVPAPSAIPEPQAAPAVAIAVAPAVAPAAAVQAPAPAAAPAPVKSTVQIKKPAPAPVVEAPVEVAPPQRKAPRPAPAAAAVAATAPRPSRVRTIAAGAAIVVVVAAIGFPLSKLWLGGQETPPIIHETQPAPAVQPAAAAPTREPEVTPVSVAVPVATTARDESAVVAPKPAPAAPVAAKANASAMPRPNTSRVPAKNVRQPVTPVKPAAATVVPSIVAAPAPEPPPAPVAAPEPKPEPPAAPVGPFFELRDVSETPRVATRVEPQLPDDLRDRQLNEVVIVRVLVTQAGQPLMVNLLRKSKAGASLDNAIVAAVKQWTFVPAKKRGEAVSCWFHVGVPVSRANH